MKEKRRIKLKDINLIELGRRMSGAKMLIQDLAMFRERATREFWNAIWEKYPKLGKRGIAYDQVTEEIIVKDTKKCC